MRDEMSQANGRARPACRRGRRLFTLHSEPVQGEPVSREGQPAAKCHGPHLPSPSLEGPPDATQAELRGMTEAEATRRAQYGEAAAFEFLYRLHGRRVYNLCLRMVGNPATAEDLTQEAFLQMFRKIGTFRGDSALSTWLHRLAVNTVLMHRRKKRLAELSLDRPSNSWDESDSPMEISTSDLALEGRIDQMNLQRAIDRLPQGYRQIFFLHDVMGFEHHEIAEMLRCSAGNSKSQLHKARKRLRGILRGEHETMNTRRSGDDSACPQQFGKPALAAARVCG